MATKLIEIDTATVDGVKVDFVKGEIRLTLALPLNGDTLALREDLALLGVMHTPCEVTIEGKQEEMKFGAKA
jgi:hypothetical protein